jgi:hypothetical protein
MANFKAAGILHTTYLTRSSFSLSPFAQARAQLFTGLRFQYETLHCHSRHHSPTDSLSTFDRMADGTSAAARMGTHDMVRAVLFVAIPAYARIFLFSPLLAALGHLYIVGTILISIVHFSKNAVVSELAWDIFYGLLLSTFLSWDPQLFTSIIPAAWINNTIKGWRWEVIYWMTVFRHLAYLFAEYYGSKIEVRYRQGPTLIVELLVIYEQVPIHVHNLAHPTTHRYLNIISAAIVYFFPWPEGMAWYNTISILLTVSSFIRYVFQALLSYM